MLSKFDQAPEFEVDFCEDKGTLGFKKSENVQASVRSMTEELRDVNRIHGLSLKTSQGRKLIPHEPNIEIALCFPLQHICLQQVQLLEFFFVVYM